jgi:hypothetical protein
VGNASGPRSILIQKARPHLRPGELAETAGMATRHEATRLATAKQRSHWQTAASEVLLAGELDGDVNLAEIAMRRAILQNRS